MDHFSPVVLDANDYYPFGSLMPGRAYNATGTYRYGFNGKENDNEVKGVGDQIDYGARVYDPRVGRFLSVDPLEDKFPFYSSYQYAGNKPTWAQDLDGAEELLGFPRWLSFPDPILSLPKIPTAPVPPLPPAPPILPGPVAMPQTPTLPPAPYLPMPPTSPSIVHNTPIDESTIDPNDASTYPTPPASLPGEWKVNPVKPGTKGYEKLKEKGATRLENERGDILRWHKADKWHPKSHWDFKPGGSPNNGWENYTPDGVKIPDGQIYGKDFNPPMLMYIDPTTFPPQEYPVYLQKEYQLSKQQQEEYLKNLQDYYQKMKDYQEKMQEYKKRRKEYDDKMQQYIKDNPNAIA
ncbi:RHS repeat domain-containing protein [Dinghuibacter silviterrae]|uniref:RHS repeat domain-containing protein n=1 Tax=Dinghuibacter silviterrae TaxID=1539049 RepID=UPI0013C2EDDA|nr:RHS repeat-associated core domain-containing protein [Dinghuibacter silviterrae]